jgi:formyltetrahydrofolate-dependent phosphoribosylglycinamide formyltransferase
MPQPIRLAVLVSGGGTTLQNLVDRSADGRLCAQIGVVISSNPGAFALERARRAGIATAVVLRKEAGSRAEFSRRIFALCREHRIDLMCLAGFLQLIEVPDDFTGKVMNIHPSLIPAFCGKGYYGRHVHEAVLQSGCKVTGCTVHFADNQYDHGPIILQASIPVLESDRADSLAERIHDLESELYPEAIRLFAAGKLRIEGRIVRVLPS